MPVDGLASWAGAAELPALVPGEDLVLDRAEILQVFYEAPGDAVRAAIPPALHPTIPGALYLTFVHCADSPWGPFTLAELRLAARLREKPRALLLRAAISAAPEASAALAAGWGLGAVAADVRLHRWYDRIEGTVVADGCPVLTAGMADPEPIPGATLQYGPLANAALVDGTPHVVLVDTAVSFGDDRQRGAPRVDVLDASWWGAPGIVPTVAIGAYYTTADLRLPAPSAALAPGVRSGGALVAVS